jgi:hypothetical protein|tara:strand:+ start:189 stop:653 length:465 start_codon:yes stop_codon:yes gene_type:complete
MAKKKPKIDVLKFNKNLSISWNKLPLDESIIVDDENGYKASTEAFVEMIKYRFFGFKKPNLEKINGGFLVRQDAPDPLKPTQDNIFDKEFTSEDLIYYEDEFLSRSMSQVEEKNATEPDYIQKALVRILLIEAIAVAVLVIAFGIPKILQNLGA